MLLRTWPLDGVASPSVYSPPNRHGSLILPRQLINLDRHISSSPWYRCSSGSILFRRPCLPRSGYASLASFCRSLFVLSINLATFFRHSNTSPHRQVSFSIPMYFSRRRLGYLLPTWCFYSSVPADKIFVRPVHPPSLPHSSIESGFLFA